jgi:hypothetical protein
VSSRTFGYYKYTTGLSFAEERIGPLAAIVTTVFYLLVLSNTPENPFASIYSDSLIKTAHQHLLLLVGFDTLIYRKYYDTPPILVGHHGSVTKLASITFLSLAFSYWTIKPSFLTEGKLLLCSSYLPLGVHNWSVIYISTGAISSQGTQCVHQDFLRIVEMESY